MAKLTDNGPKEFTEAPKSGVDIYASFYKAKPGGNFFTTADRQTHELEDMSGNYLWLGHFIRYEGQSEKHKVNFYSTMFEKGADFIEMRTKALYDKDNPPAEKPKSVSVYRGHANDEEAKMKAGYFEARYTIYLLLINTKGRLVFAKIDGMNLAPYFEFNQENGKSDYLAITGTEEITNPKKPKETVHILKFGVPENFEFEDEKAASLAGQKEQQLKEYLDYFLYYARNGKYKDDDQAGDGKTAKPANVTAQNIYAQSEESEIPAGAQTADDDLPF